MIPKGIERIGESGFENCRALTAVVFESGVCLSQMSRRTCFARSGVKTVTVPSGAEQMARVIFGRKCDIASA